jgi:hypothetical protein
MNKEKEKDEGLVTGQEDRLKDDLPPVDFIIKSESKIFEF